jgi:hypothetical protein
MRVTLHHSEIAPTSEVFHGQQIDAGHHQPAGEGMSQSVEGHLTGNSGRPLGRRRCSRPGASAVRAGQLTERSQPVQHVGWDENRIVPHRLRKLGERLEGLETPPIVRRTGGDVV